MLAWPPSGGGLLAVLREGRYDLAVDWLGNPRTALWTALSGARWRASYQYPGYFGAWVQTKSETTVRAVEEVIRELFVPLGVPVVTGLPVGHVSGKWTLPLGGVAEVDTSAGRILFSP